MVTWHKHIQVYGEEALGHSAVFDTIILRRGETVEDDEQSGWPKVVRTECKIEEVAALVRANRSQLVDIAAAVGISHDMCHRILTDDLNMLCVSEHYVPRVLMQDQCDDCMTICGDVINSADEDETFLDRIIARDERWCFLYDP
jgi:hypothetical protein